MVANLEGVRLVDFEGGKVISVNGSVSSSDDSLTSFQDCFRRLNGQSAVVYFFEDARLDLGGLIVMVNYAKRNKEAVIKVCGDKRAFFDIAEVNGVLDMAINFPNLRLCYSCPANNCPYRRT